MKAYSDNKETYGYYSYDDAGQRMYKVTLNNTLSRINALGDNVLEVEKLMLYPNGYININQDGNYTKHYYAEDARIASKIGSGFRDSISGSEVDNDDALELMQEELGLVTYDTVGIINYSFGQITHLQGDSCKFEEGLYFYHGNHLSSTQLITDMYGSVNQAVLYGPWGNIISEYRQDWMLDTIPRYLFNAKEKDEESGLYYYEARYYSDEDIVFRGRDPLFEKKPWVSPYAYCFNNPVKYIDPTGEAPGDPFKSKRKAAKDWAKYYNGASILRGKEFGSSIYKTTVNGKTRYSYSEAAEGTNDATSISPPPNGEKVVADIHSHGKYEPQYNNNDFSQDDTDDNDAQGIDGYVSTPNGSLKKYNHKTGNVTVISVKMDSDPNDPDRKNNNNPVDIPKKIEDSKNFRNSIEIETNVDYFQ